MLASTLFTTLAVLGTASAAPAQPVEDSANSAYANSTLAARGTEGKSVPENWPLIYWTMVENELVGTVSERNPDSMFEKCVVQYWGKRREDSEGEYQEAHVRCWKKTKWVAWDIKRMGDVSNCDTESKSETWTIEKGQTSTWDASAGIEGLFKMFSINLGASMSKSESKNSGYSRTVECNPDFKDKKCLIAGQAVIELETREGWVRLYPEDVDKKDENKMYDRWHGKSDQHPYGMEYYQEQVYRHVDYEYADGWNHWEGIGTEQCISLFDNRNWKASNYLKNE